MESKNELYSSSDKLDVISSESVDNSSENCVICFENKPDIQTICCKKNIFCKKCLKDNLKFNFNRKCPNCRKKYEFIEINKVGLNLSNNISASCEISNNNFQLNKKEISLVIFFFTFIYFFIFWSFLKSNDIFPLLFLGLFVSLITTGIFVLLIKCIPFLFKKLNILQTQEYMEMV